MSSCARLSENQRIRCEGTGAGAAGGAAIGALIGGASGFMTASGQMMISPSLISQRAYVDIDPKLIIDYTVKYFASKGYAIQTKDYSKGNIIGKEQPKIFKKFFWFTWKEKNKVTCQISKDLISKNKIYLYLTIQKERKKPLSSEFSPVSTENSSMNETTKFLNSLDVLVVKNGGKLG
jgi:hypothetical protein